MPRNLSNPILVALAVVVTLVLAFLIVPTLIVFPISISDTSYITFPPQGFSLRWYYAYISDPEWVSATWFSLWIALLTTIVSLIVGTLAAIAVGRGTLRGMALVSTLVLAPMIVPNITVAIAIYLQFATWRITGTVFGFVLAHSVYAVPYVFIVVSAGLQKLEFSVEMAALGLGASRWAVMREVTLPMIYPSLAGAAVFAFLTSFDETVVSFFISDTTTKTLTRKIFEDIDFNLSPIIAAVSVLVVVGTLVAIGAAQIWSSRAGAKTRAA